MRWNCEWFSGFGFGPAVGGGGRWVVCGMIFIHCQHRNTLVNIQASTSLHELSEILELYIFSISILKKTSTSIYWLGWVERGKRELWKN